MFEPPVDTTAEHPVTPGRVSSWLLAALGLAMIASAAGVLAGFRSAARWRKHTEDVRIVLLQLQDSVVDAETGQRGYLASGDRRFLERYEAGANTWRPTLERARARRGRRGPAGARRRDRPRHRAEGRGDAHHDGGA